jgi:SAM-dependent methyltransferase/uncharacterized protein YbaR (Trm112 family)
MKRRLLDWIVCPACAEHPRLEIWKLETSAVREPIAAPACTARCARHDLAPVRASDRVDCTACYGEEVLEGRLVCVCGLAFPIRDGVPRLTLEAAGAPPRAAVASDPRSRDSFSLQWTAYRESERTWFKADRTQRKEEFLFGVGARPQELAGRTLLDAGCGNGELTRSLAEYGLEVVGLDFSRSVEAAQRRLAATPAAGGRHVHYLQADVLHLPLRPGSFDLVHSSGVLHHTASTARAFAAVRGALAPGGKLYVQLYRRRATFVHLVNVTLRAVTTRLPLRLLWALCRLGAPLHAALSRAIHRWRGEQFPTGTYRERALQMFDNYSPRYQHRHTVDEVAGWFRDSGLLEVREATLANESRHMLAVYGRLPATAAATERTAAHG